MKISTFFYPLVASCISVGAAYALYLYLQSSVGVLLLSFGVSVAVAFIAYVALSLALGSIRMNDIALLPCADKLILGLEKIKKNKKEKLKISK